MRISTNPNTNPEKRPKVYIWSVVCIYAMASRHSTSLNDATIDTF